MHIYIHQQLLGYFKYIINEFEQLLGYFKYIINEFEFFNRLGIKKYFRVLYISTKRVSQMLCQGTFCENVTFILYF